MSFFRRFPKFRNMQVYLIAAGSDVLVPFDHLSLQEMLEPFRYKPCDDNARLSIGFVNPMLNDDGPLYHQAMGKTLLTIKQETRTVPAGEITIEHQKRIAAFIERTGDEPDQEQKNAMWDECETTLQKRAFSKFTVHNILVDHKNGRVICDAGSASKAESLFALVRQTFNTFPVLPATLKSDIGCVMRSFVDNTLQTREDLKKSGLLLTGNAKLVDNLEKARKMTLTDADLYGDDQLLETIRSSHMEFLTVGLKLPENDVMNPAGDQQPADAEIITETQTEAGEEVAEIVIMSSKPKPPADVTFTISDTNTLKIGSFKFPCENPDLEHIDYEDGAAVFDADMLFFTSAVDDIISRVESVFGELDNF
ncbi:recombination-associated protein [Morganella phage Mecenats66]|nr:recombination-associated protein [Morganella phage Mecenats66]